MRVLICNNDASEREQVAGILSQAGHETVLTSTAAQALDVAHEDVDLLVVNLFHPRIDGLRLAQRVHERRGPIPTIILSSVSERQVRAMNEGPAPVVVRKPFARRTILTAVSRALRLVDADY